jgi:predicted PurR-regulated permease PerM
LISLLSVIPFLAVFIGVLGGLQAFGLVGLFVGPVILSVMLVVWREWVGTQVEENALENNALENNASTADSHD